MAVITQYDRKPRFISKREMQIKSTLTLNAPIWHPHLRVTPYTTKPPNPVNMVPTGGVFGARGWTCDGDDRLNFGNLGLQIRTLILWISPAVGRDWVVGGGYMPIGIPDTSYRLAGGEISGGLTNESFGILHDAGTLYRNGITSGINFIGGTFYHIALVWDSDAVRYRAYVYAAEQTFSASGAGYIPLLTTTSFVIGNDGLGGNAQLTIGEVKISSVSFSPSDLNQHYLKTKWRYGL